MELDEKGYMAHCAGCGALTFFHNPVLLERIKFGGQLCPHHPERKPCPGVSLPGAISAGCAFFTVVAK
jgi:hypothetical protein